MLEKLAKIVQKYTDVPVDNLTEDMELVDDLELSSIDYFEIMVEIETTFRIRFKERDLQELETVGDVVKLVEKYLKQ